MNTRKDIALIVIFAVALVGLQLLFKQRPTQGDLDKCRRMFDHQRGYMGQYAPDFEITRLDGSHFKLSEQLGTNVVVLNFFATWCGPCQMELPELAYFWQQQSNRPVVFLAISDEKEDVVRALVEEKKLPFPVAVDTDSAVSEKYRVSGIPTTVVIQPSGMIAIYEVGGINNADVALSPQINMWVQSLRKGDGVSLKNYHQCAPKKLVESKKSGSHRNRSSAPSNEVPAAVEEEAVPVP